MKNLSLIINLPDYKTLAFRVDGHIQVKQLLQLVKDRLALAKHHPGVTYQISIRGSSAPLQLEKTLLAQGVLNEDHLELLYVSNAQENIQTISTLQNEKTGKVFKIVSQPAVIGRSGSNQAAKYLAVNLIDCPNSHRISRKHAEITEKNGRYYIRRLSEKGQLLVNELALSMEQEAPIQDGDLLIFADSGIILKFSIT